MRRLNFVSFTFLFAFGLGNFVGIGLALLAFALARPADETTIVEPTAQAIFITATPRPPTTTPLPTETPTSIPTVRTRSTLQVHIGPNQDYAILGTLASGSEIEIKGRDTDGDWLAIQFPPQSSARGWIPLDEVTGISRAQISDLDVVQASLNIIERSSPQPSETDTPTAFEGNDGFPVTPTQVFALPTSTPVPPTATATEPRFVTPTPVPVRFGPTDLALTGVSVGGDGSLRVTVDNLGPGDVPGVSVVVNAEGFSPELLTAGILRAGEGVGLRTTSVVLRETTAVSITLDPNAELTDANRANNTRTYTLRPE